MEPIALHDGRILQVHDAGTCFTPLACCIHHPSDHALNTAPLDWWQGVGMMRVCEHGFRHPDPDDIAFKMSTGNFIMVEAISSVHLVSDHCDGCCQR